MEYVDYKRLYALQDEILDLIFFDDTEFYLTGGTCLNRFYFEKRYSDDLDFFTNFSNSFAFSVRKAVDGITQAGIPVTRLVDEKDFIRINTTKDDIHLQVDFINDRVERFGEILVKNRYKLDNPLNILSNKITAVISRDNPKDIFDIYLIHENCSFSWSEILADAQKKLHFQIEDLLYRLETFPASLLGKLKIIDGHFLDKFEQKMSAIMIAIKSA
jgi:predicted nucleotidyltransferase component of viral defense system